MPLRPRVERLANHKEFYDKLIIDSQTNTAISQALNEIVCHWSWESKQFSQDVVSIIITGFVLLFHYTLN